MEVAVGAELGLWQKAQSDAHVAESLAPGVALLAIADGFGASGRSGQTSATFALQIVRDYLRRRQRLGAFGPRAASPSNVRALLLGALDQANAKLYAQSGSHDDFVAGGTSLTAVLIVGHHAFVGHVGDARAHVLRFGRLEALTADDAIFSDMAVPSSKASVPAKPRLKGVLWRSLGTQAKLEASMAHVELLAGDQLVLCTDGVHRVVSLDEISAALGSCDAAGDAVSRIFALAKSRGNVDNATAIVARELLVPTPTTYGARARANARTWRSIGYLVIVSLALAFLAFAAHYDPATDHRPGIVGSP